MATKNITLDPALIQQLIEKAVEEQIVSAVQNLGTDPVWLSKIEQMINQSVVQQTLSTLRSVDINEIIAQRVDENIETVRTDMSQKFASTGIADQATSCQLTIMDDTTVVENELAAKDLTIVGTAKLGNLIVSGTINTESESWDTLAQEISTKTLEKLTDEWTDGLIKQTIKGIQAHGIEFDQVQLSGEPLLSGNRLASVITETNIQRLGFLQNLSVGGEAHIYDTLSVMNKRIGINTQEPESALSIWDEEVSVIIGKHKEKQAYIGTSRNQGLVLGVNRQPQVEIDIDGLTTIKKLRVGLYRISHATEVPGYSGTRGDLVFNANLGPDRIFGWMCLGGHKWQTLKSAE